MRRRRAVALCALAGLMVGSAATPARAENRYELVHGCYVLKSRSLGRFVAKTAEGGYRASATAPGGGEGFRMQATQLGRYLLYGRARDFMAGGSPGLLGSANAVHSAERASEQADWRVDEADGGGFRITLPAAGKALAVEGDGDLVVADSGAVFSFEQASGCPAYPEVETNAVGDPARGPQPYGQVSGLIDGHMHMMAFEFLGGKVHCGRPWHPYGAEYALVDCPDHYPNGAGAVLENALAGGSRPTHDPVGWPTFRDWPHHASLTHESSYYKWLERSWRGGLRVFVNLFVDNAVLCELYPQKQNSCNEMDGVRLQARRIRELENYIDAQSGGPGKGWFRIVSDPFEARRVINQGKLAVVPGIEVSKLFDCGVNNDQPECDRAQIDRQLDEVYRLGVRQMELINKFDNALGGVAGDEGQVGVVTNAGNRYETGRFWSLEHCPGPAADKPQLALPGTARDPLVGNALQTFLPPGATPIYPEPPHCNRRGLTDLGEHVVRRMVEKKMIVDPDHLSVLARNHLISIVESLRYSGLVSSHSWSTSDSYPRIYATGGVITPYAGSSTEFVRQWREIRTMTNARHFWGAGYGADMNGFGTQGGPRNGPNPVRYPFRSFDGKVTLNKQRSGTRVYDINVDGVAHYGLFPDWLEDLRMIAGDQIVRDMGRGAEAYLQMWERAEGIPARHCRGPRGRFTRGGMGHARLGDTVMSLLRRAGQPETRSRAWRWCVAGRGNGSARVVAVFTPQERVGLVASTARGHRRFAIGPGAPATRLRRRARRFGPGILVSNAGRGVKVVYGIRRGRIRFVAVATGTVSRNPARLRGYLRLAGLR